MNFSTSNSFNSYLYSAFPYYLLSHFYMPTKWAAAWQNKQNELCVKPKLRPVWASTKSDQSSLSAWTSAGSLATQKACTAKNDQTGCMPRLIWVFAGHRVMLLILSRSGSNCLQLIFSDLDRIGSNLFTWTEPHHEKTNLGHRYAKNKGAD